MSDWQILWLGSAIGSTMHVSLHGSRRPVVWTILFSGIQVAALSAVILLIPVKQLGENPVRKVPA